MRSTPTRMRGGAKGARCLVGLDAMEPDDRADARELDGGETLLQIKQGTRAMSLRLDQARMHAWPTQLAVSSIAVA
eukprot:5523192-Pleurochrysis_carterae.AAC.5